MSLLDDKLVERMLKSKDDIFWKSLSYLQSGEKGFHDNTSPEKMTLDFMKSIELLIKLWKGRSFSIQLKNASKELGIDKDDCDEIKKLWRLRSGGDVAHSKRGSKADFYPAQYPVPSNVDGPYIDSSSLAVRVLTKYFLFRDSILSIKLTDKEPYDVDELIDVNQGSVFVIKPSNKDKKNLTPFLKKKISVHFGIPLKNIKLYSYQLPDIHNNKIPKKVIVIFGTI